MEKNRKKFLHKVVEFLVKDTIIDYGDNHIDFPFFPMYRLYINDANLDYFFHKGRYSQYCKDNYGLTHEESLYVWGIYIDMIKEKINNRGGSINESDDRRKNFLDKVVDFLVKDTKVDYEDREIFFPFTLKKSLRQNTDNATSFHKILFHKDSIIPLGGFMEYIEEMYGITDIKDVSYVWGKYKDVMRYIVFGNDPTNEPIYESEDKRKGYLNKIIVLLVTGTIIDWKEERVRFPFLPEYNFAFFQYPFTTLGKVPTHLFTEYCKEQYGLTEDEVEYVWKFYVDTILGEYNNKSKLSDSSFMNESEDNKQKYLNKILKWFVDDTIIRYETGVIIYPFSQIGPNGKPLPSFIDDLKNKLSWGMSSDIQATCRDTYGLNYDETKYIWNNYKKIIKDRYNKESIMYDLKPINESEDKKQIYLDKVVDWLVDDTEIGDSWFNPPYYYPGSTAGRTGFRSVYGHTFGLLINTSYSGLETQLIYFNSYCKNNYGLTEDETKLVWRQYMKRLYDSYDWIF